MKERSLQPEPVSGPQSGREIFESFFDSPGAQSQGWGPSQPFRANTELFQEGSPATVVYFIERGLVKLSCSNVTGQQLVVGLRRRHWVLGGPAALLRRPHAATASTLTDCSLRCISAQHFLNLSQTDHQFSSRIHQMLSEEIYSQVSGYLALGCLNARQRLERFLGELIGEEDPPGRHERLRIRLPLSYSEMAEAVAVRPEYLSCLLKGMESEGILKRGNGWLSILKTEHFRQPQGVCRMKAGSGK